MSKHTRVLAYCNGIRAELGLPAIATLSKGTVYFGYSCPVSRSISSGTGLDVCASSAGLKIESLRYKLPNYVLQFMHDFDKGKFPELIDEG